MDNKDSQVKLNKQSSSLCFNGWLPLPEYGEELNKRIREDGDCLVKFDNGTICRFKEEHPFAILTHFK